jgi:hypothetical protein
MQSAPETSTLGYFKWAFIVTAVGLLLGLVLGWQTTGTIGGTATVFFIVAVLAVLEISLSFDNAIVNANKLKDMTPEWQHRFLTWGIIIAVFGMRIIFPLLIVVIAAKIGPIDAMIMAAGANGWIDEERAMMESLGAFKRAGCTGIITYFAPRAARLLKG